MESSQVANALGEQSNSIRAVIDEVEERKGELNEKFAAKLKDLGLIKYAIVGKGKLYSDGTAVYDRKIVRNEIFYKFIDKEVFYIIEDLLIIYKDSIPCPDFINCIIDCDKNKEGLSKKELSLHRKKYGRNTDGVIDALVDLFFDVFPHPYHV